MNRWLIPEGMTIPVVGIASGLALIGLISSGIDTNRAPEEKKTQGFRFVAAAAVFLAGYYIYWRYRFSLNYRALWFAVPLLAAETYAFLDSVLFAVMMWKPAFRKSRPPLESCSVDVFITTYNEPPELVGLTIEAAARISWADKQVHVLDDGSRPEIRALAERSGCRVITRGKDWDDKPRHAKAGNVNNALLQTSGDFILILDADQIPSPGIIEKTIGYFRDEKVAFVQTPQHFYNTPPGDPFGSDAPLFYGPILQGKDGWNAAFFCGSNALLRREALLQLGITEYSRSMVREAKMTIRRMQREFERFRPTAPSEKTLKTSFRKTLKEAESSLKKGKTVNQVFEMIRADLRKSRPEEEPFGTSMGRLLEKLSSALEITRPGEAIPILPLATSSITEDMATSIRLHALGWKSVFHHEILAQGLAPEDLGSALSQRLRWAQGTIQVLMRENPLTVKGLTLAQRLQYFTTIHSYFSGFASLIFIASPLIFLFTGIAPVNGYSAEFLWRLVPFLLFNMLMFRFVARGTDVKRGQQYSLSLFPVWIKAVASVLLGRNLRFVVTPKERQSGKFLRLVRVQILFIVLSCAACVFALVMFLTGKPINPLGLGINLFWAVYNTLKLSVIVKAAVYDLPDGWNPRPDADLLAENSG